MTMPICLRAYSLRISCVAYSTFRDIMIEIHLDKIKPQELVDRIKDLIDKNRFGFWKIDNEGDYYLEDWRNKAWMTCKVDETDQSLVRFCIIKSRNGEITKDMYAENHARFLQMLLVHFDDSILSINVSPLLSEHDN